MVFVCLCCYDFFLSFFLLPPCPLPVCLSVCLRAYLIFLLWDLQLPSFDETLRPTSYHLRPGPTLRALATLLFYLLSTLLARL